MQATSTSITRILSEIKAGERGAENALMDLVYHELYRLAEREAEWDGRHQATTLVDEAYVRLVGPSGALNFNSRAHFFTAAAIAMRRICIDDARSRRRVKRGAGRPAVALPETLAAPDSDSIDHLALGEALEELRSLEPRWAAVVEYRFYAGRTREEIAELLAIAPRTVDQDWRFARAWLSKTMSGD